MKWEYLKIIQEYTGWMMPDNCTRVTFNDLGALGWELVSVVQTPDDELCAYFKRQVKV